MLHFILGGNRSGKSAYALSEFRNLPGPGATVVMARAEDTAFRAQIAAHREERGPDIPVIETGADLAATLAEACGRYRTVLADGLDFWVFERMRDGDFASARDRLLDFLGTVASGTDGSPGMTGELLLVSVEIGLGPLAGDSFTRTYVRNLGGLNMAVAALADRATLVAAGLPIRLR